jgi:hypothetical protein
MDFMNLFLRAMAGVPEVYTGGGVDVRAEDW